MSGQIIALQSSSPNFPFNLKREIGNKYPFTRYASLPEFITGSARHRPYILILELGNAADCSRALVAYEWAQAVQPTAPVRFMLLPTKSIPIDENLKRLANTELAALPLTAKNLHFKLDLQLKLLSSTPSPSGGGEPRGFTAEVKSLAGKGRVLLARGPKQGGWKNEGQGPSGKVRWRWVDDPAAAAAMPEEARAFRWVSEAPEAPQFIPGEGWMIGEEGTEISCWKEDEKIFGIRPDRDMAEELRAGSERLGGPAESHFIVGSHEDEEANPEKSSYMAPERSGLIEHPGGGQAKEESTRISGSAAEKFRENEKVSADFLPTDSDSIVRAGGEARALNNLMGANARASENADYRSDREGEEAGLYGAHSEAEKDSRHLEGKIGKEEERVSSWTDGKPNPDAQLGSSLPPRAGAAEEPSRVEIEKAAAAARLAAEREKRAGEFQPVLPEFQMGQGDAASAARSEAERTAEKLAEREAHARAARREAGSREFIPAARPNRTGAPGDSEALLAAARGEAQLEKLADLTRKGEATAMEEKAPPAPMQQDEAGAFHKNMRRESESTVVNPAHKTPRDASTLFRGEARSFEEEGLVKGPGPAVEHAEMVRGSAEKAKPSANDLAQRARFELSLQDLNDKNSAWEPRGIYRIYLSAQHRYRGYAKLADLFPMWIYQGELAPEFLDQKLAWRFYDRPPTVCFREEELPLPLLDELRTPASMDPAQFGPPNYILPGEVFPKVAAPLPPSPAEPKTGFGSLWAWLRGLLGGK
jgi:hypothetical protein